MFRYPWNFTNFNLRNYFSEEASSASQEEMEIKMEIKMEMELALIEELEDILVDYQGETEHTRADKCRRLIEASMGETNWNGGRTDNGDGDSDGDGRTGGGSDSNSHDSNEVNMTLDEFFMLVVKGAKKRWPNNRFLVGLFFDSEEESRLQTIIDTSDDESSIKNWYEKKETKGNLNGEFNLMVVTKLVNNNSENESAEGAKLTKLTQTEIDRHFGEDNIRKLWKFAKTQLLPLDKVHGIIGVNQDYVNYENATDIDPRMYGETDKARPIVIAGESGSGKSVLSCLIAQKYNYLPFYILLDTDLPDEKATKTNIEGDGYEENEDCGEMERRNKAKMGKEVLTEKGNQEEDETHAEYREILEEVIVLLDSVNNTADCVEYLCTMKQRFNVARNEWAKKVLKHCVTKFVSKDKNAKALFDKKRCGSSKPDKVAIILDEATDIDLVEGLIEVWRDVQDDYSHLAQTHVQLILTGTGLDAIDRRGRARGRDRVGTGHGKSYVMVKLKEPKLEELPISRQMKEAINAGVYSRVLKTNARMLFRGIIPTMRSRFFSTDAMYESETRNLRVLDRLKGVGSTRVIMDYSVRFYVSQNSVGQMNSNKREKLLKDAFLYHLISSVENMIANNNNDSSILNHSRHKLGIWNEWRKSLGVGEDEIFKRGLAAEYATSPALKYLASFGLTTACEACRSCYGGEFEELVALHVTRLMEVEGYDVVKRIKLRYSCWPPQATRSSSTKMIGQAELNNLETALKDVMDGKEEIDWPKCDRFCIIFSQGTPSAQGPDFFVLVRGNEGYHLDAIHCKHLADYSKEEFMSGWESLGYAKRSDGSWEFGRSRTKAGYSYVGIKAFADYVSSLQNERVTIRNMILATSLEARPNAEVPILPSPPITNSKTSSPQIWFREMLEPTISIFDPDQNKSN